MKDRKGGVGPMGAHVCNLHFTPTGTEAHTATRWEDAPAAETSKDGKPLPTAIMTRIYEHISELEKGDSQTRIMKSIKGKGETKICALKCLVANGTLRRDEGDNGSLHYTIIDVENKAEASAEATPAEPAAEATRSKS